MNNKVHSTPKVTIVGDGAVGKTCVLETYAKKVFPIEYVPTVFDNFEANVPLDGQVYKIGLWDTAGQEDYDRLRPLSYPGTQVFIICYAVNSRDSYGNILTRWIPEVRHHVPTAKIILVGTKKDLRPPSLDEANAAKFLTPKDGNDLKMRIMADRYMECSALTQEGLDAIFQEATRLILGEGNTSGKGSRKSFCCLV